MICPWKGKHMGFSMIWNIIYRIQNLPKCVFLFSKPHMHTTKYYLHFHTVLNNPGLLHFKPPNKNAPENCTSILQSCSSTSKVDTIIHVKDTPYWLTLTSIYTERCHFKSPIFSYCKVIEGANQYWYIPPWKPCSTTRGYLCFELPTFNALDEVIVNGSPI